MKSLTAFVIFAFIGTPAVGFEQEKLPPAAKARIEAFTGQAIGKAKRLQQLAMFEITIGKQVIYSDATGQYIFIGGLFDAQTRKNLTQGTLQELNLIKFDELPVDDAIVVKRGDGKRKVAVFSDVNCSFCRRLDNMLDDFNNSTVYIFMNAGSSEAGQSLSRDIWCAPSRQDAWSNFMRHNIAPAIAPSGCVSPNERVRMKAKELNVSGTPTLFFRDGSRFVGTIGRAQLEARADATPRPD